MKIVIFKNNTSRILSFDGKDIQPSEIFEVNCTMQETWRSSSDLFKLVADGDLIVSNGQIDFSAIEGWMWFTGEGDLPKSEVGNKLWVHSSGMPVVEGKSFYSIWVGAGDDTDNHIMGGGELLVIQNEPGTPMKYVEMKFDDEVSGEVYLREGCMMWQNAKVGDYINAHIIADASKLQTLVNLDLIIDERGYVLYSPLGPGTGTHGFASTPLLLPRTFSHDGDWDYNENDGLRPNFSKTGNYKISQNEHLVHKIMQRLPVLGSSAGLTRLVSEDSMRLRSGYKLRIECHNMSDSAWSAAFIITVYKERTSDP